MYRTFTTSILIAFLIFGVAVMAQGPGSGPGGGGPGSGPGSFPGHRGYELEHNLVLPQMAVGQDISTTLVIRSRGNVGFMPWLENEDLQVKGDLTFFSPDGSPLMVQVNGNAATSTYSFEMDPAEMLFLEITSTGPNTAGWGLITVEQPETSTSWGMMDGQTLYRSQRLMATGFYTITGESGELVSKVAVLPSIYERSHYFNSELVAQYGPGVNTGVAIVNTSSNEVSIRIQLKDPAGETVADTSLSLEGGHQIARFVDQIFEGAVPDGFQGALEVAATDEGIVVMGLLLTDGILTSIPTHHFGGWQQGGPAFP